ncbi:MAG: hypothetical protein AAGA48_33345 [Myxococcota bacterium]
MLTWWLLALAGCTRVLDLDAEDEPATCVPVETPEFRLPSVRWGLATLYASRRLSERTDAVPQLRPAWFLASAWQATGFGCAAYRDPFAGVNNRLDRDEGCLGIRRDKVWNEICVLYPSIFPCDAYPGTLAGDTPEASALTLAWYAVAAHALLGRFEVDPNVFYDEATDPRAAAELSAALHVAGPDLNSAGIELSGCEEDVAACLDGEVRDHVLGVTEKLDALDAADCIDIDVPNEELSGFIDGLASRIPDFDADDALSAAQAAEPTLSAVVAAVEQASPVSLICPEAELKRWYGLSCP